MSKAMKNPDFNSSDSIQGVHEFKELATYAVKYWGNIILSKWWFSMSMWINYKLGVDELECGSTNKNGGWKQNYP